MTDPHYNEWIQVARVAARLDQWEVVLQLYYRSYHLYRTNTTGLFDTPRWREWLKVADNRETHERINREVRAELERAGEAVVT